MERIEIDNIKELAKEYKKYYPHIFSVDVPKSNEFREFLTNSRFCLLEVLDILRFDNSNKILDLLFEKYDKRISGNDTGCSVLRSIFYISLTREVLKKAKLSDTKEFVVDVDDKEALKGFLEMSRERNEWQNGNKWYRGQSNFEWDLFPSFYRNIRSASLIKIDGSYLFNDYDRFGLIEKAFKTIGYSSIDYNFLSFMQHSVSFSPLLDFSKNPIVATVMGLSDTDNFREHYGNDSSLFELTIDNDKVVTEREMVDGIFRNFNIYYAKEIPFLQSINVKGRVIVINDMDNLVEALTPNYVLIDIPTNDRMRYQAGKFILFYDCLILDRKVYAELAPGMKLTRYKIHKSIKMKKKGVESFLDELLKEYPEFSLMNMMNPYEWFGR